MIAFSASTLLVERQEEHLASNKLGDEELSWLSLEQVANDFNMAQLMPLPPHQLLLH